MCDYSLENVASRPAVVADKLVTTTFRNAITRGFSGIDDPKTAVCLRPGTELSFERPPLYNSALLGFWSKCAPAKVALFRHINEGKPHVHHDAWEFSDGTIIELARLHAGQRATVLQLPADEIPPANRRSVSEGSTELLAVKEV